MFKMMITNTREPQQLTGRTTTLISEEAARVFKQKSKYLYYFNLFIGTDETNVIFANGVIVNFDYTRENVDIAETNRFIIDEVVLKGTAIDLDTIPPEIKTFLQEWSIGGIVTYADLLHEFENLDDNVTIIEQGSGVW